ncbi:MAG: 4-alpha-glucanotransferase [Rhodanobacteraceae bacterium]
MSDQALRQLAESLGIETAWTGFDGQRREVLPDTLAALVGALGFAAGSPQEISESSERLARRRADSHLPALATATVGRAVALDGSHRAGTKFRIDLESGQKLEGQLNSDSSNRLPPIDSAGYHRLTIGDEETELAVAPLRCFSLRDIESDGPAKRWGLAAQIHALRRPQDFGIGDFSTLAQLAEKSATLGADALAMSPVHAMFGAAPEKYSPYSPSSRLFLNALLIDPADCFDPDEIAASLQGLRMPEIPSAPLSQLINWPLVGERKLKMFRALYRRFCGRDDVLTAAFAAFKIARGAALARHSLFEALHEQYRGTGADDWRSWLPSTDSQSDQKTSIQTSVDFHSFLQWLADRGLERAQIVARDSGMAIGLIADLAVGSDPCGSDAWVLRDQMLGDITIGAPPDYFNLKGQDWGLTAFSPEGLRRFGFRGFIDTLRAAMRHSGGVRIDHVMNLRRLWVVPRGASALDGAYIRYPMDDLLRLVTLESQRHCAIVIGEDLGVVPQGFRELMRNAGILGTEVLFFARDREGSFLPPDAWRRDAVAMTSTHDLPTLAGWWQGGDITLRKQIGLNDPEEASAEVRSRACDRKQLASAIRGALEGSGLVGNRLQPGDPATTFVAGAIAFVGATASRLALLPLEDAFALTDQPNVPGTVDEHPNWRRRMPEDTAVLLTTPPVAKRLRAMADARRKS